MKRKQRVVITGLGVATPIGIGIEPFWNALIEGRNGIAPLKAFDPSGLGCRIGGELPPFSIRDYIPKAYRKSAKVMSRDINLAVICAYHAVVDAGLRTKCLIDRGEASGEPSVDSTRFGANIGAGLVCADLSELAEALSSSADERGRFSLVHWGEEGMTNLTPLWLLKSLPNMLACHVTIVHDAQAPSNTITCGEASGHLAIGEAFRTLVRGDADVCVCGGAESKIQPMAIARPQLWGWLNTECNGTPENACCPFGEGRRGMVPAEGGGLIILETLEHARSRGARIYAELVGFGASSNAESWSVPDPSGAPISLALEKAIADAETGTGDIQLAVPFGVGTAEHDASEIAGWNDVFGNRLENMAAFTTRGATGNNGAGSGAIDIAAAVMALHRNTVPPSVGTSRLDPACRFRFAQGEPEDANARQAVSVAYALAGGQAAALVIRRLEE